MTTIIRNNTDERLSASMGMGNDHMNNASAAVQALAQDQPVTEMHTVSVSVRAAVKERSGAKLMAGMPAEVYLRD